MLQQPTFECKCRTRSLTTETTKAICRHHTMAGHNQRHGVMPAGHADRPRMGSQRFRDFTIGSHFPGGDGSEGKPDPLLESGSPEIERQGELTPPAAEIGSQLFRHPAEHSPATAEGAHLRSVGMKCLQADPHDAAGAHFDRETADRGLKFHALQHGPILSHRTGKIRRHAY